MNISTLSQQLNMSVQEVRRRMAELGYSVSPRQRKIDNQAAKEVLEKLGVQITDTAISELEQNESSKVIMIPARIMVKDLAAKMNLPVVDVIKAFIKNGVMANMNEEVDFDTAAIVAADFGFDLEFEVATVETVLSTGYVAEVLKVELEDAEKAKDFVARPPIVAIMGHVDHGKTTLLDTLRHTNVVAEESGAITQHIGAYQVEHNGKLITFLDTPGHEAFTQMRARGANVTDIIILVVAADDGVKPQTVEVINRARLANVPIIVAINKVDKPEANIDRIKQQLAEVGVMVEDWGGKVISVPVSAKSGQGLDQLLDMTLLLAEVENYRANPKGQVVGTVVESHISRGQGPSATVIVQNGTLKVGSFIVAGSVYGKIRNMEDSKDQKITKAGPSTPVLIVGISELPQSGDIFREVPTQEEARRAAKDHAQYIRARNFMNPGIVASGKVLNLVLKADVQGSLEAIEHSLEELKSRTEEVQLTIVDKSVGEINESDILRAESAGATIVGFHTRPTASASSLAKTKKVTIDLYDVIYELLEDVTRALVSMLAPEVIHSVVGTAKILAVFRTDANGQIIGGRVEDGKAINGGKFKLKRDGEEIGTGEAMELQRNKQSASEVLSGSEFGLKVKTTTTVAEGDVLEFFSEEVRARKLA